MELHVIEREGRETVVLLDNEMRIVKPVYDYLKLQRQKDKALNTLKASGSDLRTYWEFLNDNGYEYDKVTPKMIAEFIDYLRASDDDVIALNKESKRTNKTINRILSTIHMFYQFEADMQEIDNPILMHDVNRPFNSFKGILEHAKSDNKTKQSIFKVKESDYKIRNRGTPMNDEHKEKIYYIQQQADELCVEISKLMRKDADLSEKHLNELIKLGVFISMTCQELLDEK